jgi:hypothetical protein
MLSLGGPKLKKNLDHLIYSPKPQVHTVHCQKGHEESVTFGPSLERENGH